MADKLGLLVVGEENEGAVETETFSCGYRNQDYLEYLLNFHLIFSYKLYEHHLVKQRNTPFQIFYSHVDYNLVEVLQIQALDINHYHHE